MIEKKAAGEEIAVQPQVEEAAPVPDLMAALKASLDAVRSDGRGHAAGEEADAARSPRRRSRPPARRLRPGANG